MTNRTTERPSMIPPEVADLASLIWSDWSELPDKERNEILGAAWRIYNAGWRKPETQK